jgi:cephalosporin hydroxylase
MQTLEQLYWKYKKGDWPDKNSVHSYIPFYEEILKPYRHTAKNVLEIGLMSGESLRMWNNYFDGTVYGMDCDLKPINGQADLTEAIKEGYNILIGDATSKYVIESVFKKIKFDVIIEDANHDIDQQITIYQNFKPYMKHGGIYIIEDVQDIDRTKTIFEIMGGKVIDRRHIKNRYDDVLIIFQ